MKPSYVGKIIGITSLICNNLSNFKTSNIYFSSEYIHQRRADDSSSK